MPGVFAPFGSMSSGIPKPVANYVTPTGQRVQNGAIPKAGTPYYESAALIPNAAGGAQTAQGDAANPFRGYVSPEGGGFGGYDSIADPTTGLTVKQYGEKVATAKQGMAPIDWSKVTSRSNIGGRGLTLDQNSTMLKDIEGLERRLAMGEALTDDERSRLVDTTENPFRSAADAQRLGYDFQTGARLGSASPAQPTPDVNAGEVELNDARSFSPTGDSMIPATANPAQTPQAQGPNPLIPFYSGRPTGLGMTAEVNSAGPQVGTGFLRADGPSDGPITEPGVPTEPIDFGGSPPIGAAQSFGGGGPVGASGGSGMRGGSLPIGFQRFAPTGYPSGEDPRKRRRRPGPMDQYAPMDTPEMLR